MAGERSLTVATLNVNGLSRLRQDSRTRSLLKPYGDRFPELGRQIEAAGIDLINLQEVFTHAQRKLLAEYLPSFGYSAFAPAAFGPKGGLVTFSKLPLKTVHYESFFYATESADRSKLPFASLAKSALKGILVSQPQDTPLTILNTHPLANSDWDWSPNNRFHSLETAQLSQIADMAREITNNGDLLVLGGDLNVSKDSGLFKGFLGRAGLHDLFTDDMGPTVHADFTTAERSSVCLDYLLTGNYTIPESDSSWRFFEEKTVIAGIGEAYLTDHCGLAAKLYF